MQGIYTSTEELIELFKSMTKKEKDQARALLLLEMLMAGNDKERLEFISKASKLLKQSRK